MRRILSFKGNLQQHNWVLHLRLQGRIHRHWVELLWYDQSNHSQPTIKQKHQPHQTKIKQDINECTSNTTTNNCMATLATCTNTVGSFTCTCNTGYSGTGVACAGKGFFLFPSLLWFLFLSWINLFRRYGRVRREQQLLSNSKLHQYRWKLHVHLQDRIFRKWNNLLW